MGAHHTQVKTIQAPALLHSEPDLLVKIVRDVFNEDFTRMLIQGDEALTTISNYLAGVAPDLLERVEKYEGEQDPFDAFRITEQIEKALDRKVWLPSGGSLVIDRTEAMTVVDVNTGKFVGSAATSRRRSPRTTSKRRRRSSVSCVCATSAASSSSTSSTWCSSPTATSCCGASSSA